MNVHERLMITFAVIAEQMMIKNRESKEPEHPVKVMMNTMNCLLANEFEGESVDETFEAYKLADEKKKEEMFELALHFVGMSIAHIESFVEKYFDEEDTKTIDAAGDLKQLLDNTGLSLN
tara:strand:+ start:482 stop:841 length:360 start_codon:yes stop_codon:yes gene_type:complete